MLFLNLWYASSPSKLWAFYVMWIKVQLRWSWHITERKPSVFHQVFIRISYLLLTDSEGMMDTENSMSSAGGCRNDTVTLNEVFYPTWLSSLLLLFAFVGFLSNILVSVTILKSRFLQDVTHYLILNLAVSDSLCCFMFGLDMFLDLLHYPKTDTSKFARKLYCRLFYGNYLFQSFAYVSAYNLVIISLERYIGIVHPLRYVQICSKANIRGAVLTAWLLGFCAYMIHLFGFVYENSSQGCKA